MTATRSAPNTCRACGTDDDVVDGWCWPCFSARADRLVWQIDHAQPDTVVSVYVSGMRELGATDEQMF